MKIVKSAQAKGGTDGTVQAHEDANSNAQEPSVSTRPMKSDFGKDISLLKSEFDADCNCDRCNAFRRIFKG